MNPPIDRDGDFYRELLENLYDGVYLVDRERRITFWNKGARRLTGYDSEDVLGIRCSGNLLAHVDREGRPLCTSDLCPAEAAMRDGRVREEQVFLRHRDGHRVPVRTRIAPVRSPDGAIVGALEIFSDDAAAVAAAQEIARLESVAMLDVLTGVGNRRFAEVEMESRLGALKRHGWAFGVAFVDVDRFKTINDGFGHAVGDALLRLVAQTLRRALRTTDTVARWGGEEFVVLLAEPRAADLRHLCERLARLVESAQVIHDGRPVRVTVSIGATHARPDDTPLELIDRADRLMYASKNGGGNQVIVEADP